MVTEIGQARSSLKVFLIAGEASGDAYGAEVIQSLRKASEQAGLKFQAVGWGGDLMSAAGMQLLTHFSTMNFMGFVEVVKHLPAVLGNISRAVADIERERPDVVLTIDFPGFNMRVAQRLKKRGHPALRVHWVCPQIWAWKPGRVHQLKRDFDFVAPILPFEHELLASHDIQSWDLGHPLLDVLPTHTPTEKTIPLLLMPGSRTQELNHHLPVMVGAALQGHRDGRWAIGDVVLAGAPGREPGDYVAAEKVGIRVTFGQTHQLLSAAQCAWVASGTATLEAALIGTPHLVVYKTSGLTYALAKRLAQVSFIGLPNLLSQSAVVPELIQDQFTEQALLEHTHASMASQHAAFDNIRKSLGGQGASQRLANAILDAVGRR